VRCAAAASDRRSRGRAKAVAAYRTKSLGDAEAFHVSAFGRGD
jgi:hypothetical protein